ncbi:MAG: flavin reductase family protein [Gemmataceae bacterium]|nr:flavin reductase family protein [Gemmataceae bacterium]
MKAGDAEHRLAAALGRIPSGIFVVTARRGSAATGMLASWVQQCSFQPPRLTLAVKPQRPVAAWLSLGDRFTLNILEASQTDMVAHFGKGFALADDAFHGVNLRERDDGAPVLAEALAFLDCRVVQRVPAGDHDLVIADLEAGDLIGDGQPMIHVRKNGMHY